MKNQSKNQSKINENEARLGSKIDAKLMKNRSKNKSKINAIWDRFLMALGWVLGWIWGPSWGQDGTKIDEKWKLKN